MEQCSMMPRDVSQLLMLSQKPSLRVEALQSIIYAGNSYKETTTQVQLM